jgi:hypothetical protein
MLVSLYWYTMTHGQQNIKQACVSARILNTNDATYIVSEQDVYEKTL